MPLLVGVATSAMISATGVLETVRSTVSTPVTTCSCWATMGAPEVAVEARHPHQHETRGRIGALVPSAGYDVVIETAGSESGLHRAVELARPGGTVVYVGVYGDITWPHGQAFMKEVALRPSLGYCGHDGRREFSQAAAMLAARPELPKILITHRFPIDDAAEAFRVARDRSNGVFRVVVEP